MAQTAIGKTEVYYYFRLIITFEIEYFYQLKYRVADNGYSVFVLMVSTYTDR